MLINALVGSFDHKLCLRHYGIIFIIIFIWIYEFWVGPNPDCDIERGGNGAQNNLFSVINGGKLEKYSEKNIMMIICFGVMDM